MVDKNDTKEIIACAFKELSSKKAIDKISITDIMKQADYRRQTFYDYFDDKYDLITWIFSYELSKMIQPEMGWKNWDDFLLHLLKYLEENKEYYKKIFLNIKLDSFKGYVIYCIKQTLTKLADEYFEGEMISKKKAQMVQTTIDFYSYGLAETLYHWVLENCEPDSRDYHELLVDAVVRRTHI